MFAGESVRASVVTRGEAYQAAIKGETHNAS